MNQRQEQNYQKLLDALAKMYESTMVMGVEAQQQQKVRTFMKMGQLMLKADLQQTGRAKYGDNAMQRISEDMTQRYGGGFKQRNVYYIRDFAGQFSDEALRPELTWNHYKTLLRVKDPAIREAMAAKLEAGYMPVKQFQELVRQVVRGESPAEATGGGLADLFVPRKAQPGIYKLTQESFGKKAYFLDLGFRVALPVSELGMSKESLKDFCAGEYVAPVGTSSSLRGFKGSSGTVLALKKVTCKPGERYCYNGVISDVVDGDTVRVRVSVGFGVYIDERFRLRGVAAPERKEEGGPAAAAFAASLVAPGDPVRILTYSRDKYGRWVADVFFGKKKDRLLNLEMVESGNARFVKM